MYRSILVPLDGSTFAEHALPLALSVARRAGATLHVVRIVPLPIIATEATLFPDEELVAALKAQPRAYLDDVVKRLGSQYPVPVTPAVLEGDIPAGIGAHASACRADLVLMATHGRGPLRRFWLGSVADTLVRQLPVPLLLVRPEEGAANLAAEPSLEHVVVPVDGSPLAEQILEPAVALGSLLGADYTLLRVVQPIQVADQAPAGSSYRERVEALLDRIQAIHEQLVRQAQDYLDGLAKQLRARGLHVQTRVRVAEHPAAAILEEAEARPGSLVALATHGRRGLARVFLGSVADKVVRGAPGPVLIHRPAGL